MGNCSPQLIKRARNEPELERKLLRFAALSTAFVVVSTLNSFKVDIWAANDDMNSYCYYVIFPFYFTSLSVVFKSCVFLPVVATGIHAYCEIALNSFLVDT